MKNTKKIISLVLAICMLASLAISASAANTVDASGDYINVIHIFPHYLCILLFSTP